MADTKIRGVTIEIGGDTTGLKKALSNVNDEVIKTKSALKDVEKLLKLDPKNTELLTQKQRLLNQQVGDYEKKLNTLKSAQKEFTDAVANGDEKARASYDALQREIISTEDYLKKAKEEAKNFNVNLEKAKVTANNVADATGNLAKKTKALSAAAAGVVTAFGTMAYKAVQNADDLNTLAQQSGLTTEEIQKFQFAADVVDVSTDTIVGALRKMRKNMDSTSTDVQEAWATIGVSVRDANGEFRDSTEVFYDVLDGLSKIDNETERDILAYNLFGKSADELAGIIDDGGQALKELGIQAEKTGSILDQETLDSLNEINDQIDILKSTIKGQLAQTAAKAMEALTPVFEKLVGFLNKVLEYVAGLSAEKIEKILKIAGVVALLSPVLTIISKLATGISGFLTLIPKITGVVSKLFGLLTANPIFAIIAAVAALTALVIANWDKIKPVLDNIWAKVKEIFGKIKDFILKIFDGIKEAFKKIINAAISYINTYIKGINLLIKGINKLLSGINKVMNTNIGMIGEVNEIPMLAKGGVLTSGSAIVGENGAELLSLVNGQAVVRPLNNTISASEITKGVVNGLAPFQNNGQNLTLQVLLDGNVIAETIYDSLTGITKRKVVANG